MHKSSGKTEPCMANITNSKKGQFVFVRNNDFCSDVHYETHLELKYLKVSVPTLIWVCYGSKMQ